MSKGEDDGSERIQRCAGAIHCGPHGTIACARRDKELAYLQLAEPLAQARAELAALPRPVDLPAAPADSASDDAKREYQAALRRAQAANKDAAAVADKRERLEELVRLHEVDLPVRARAHGLAGHDGNPERFGARDCPAIQADDALADAGITEGGVAEVIAGLGERVDAYLTACGTRRLYGADGRPLQP